MSDSVQPQRWQPIRLPRPWDIQARTLEWVGKNTGVGCHFLLQCMKVKSKREVTQSCPTLSDPVDCSIQASLAITNFRSLLKSMSIESVMPCNHLILCHPLLLLPSILPSIMIFQMSQFFTSGGQSIGASASVLPMNIQD